MARRGRRGDGTVYYSRRDRRWIARFPLPAAAGRRRDKRVKCRTRDEAKAELEQLRRAYRAGTDPATDTLGDYLRDWLAAHRRKVRASTAISYEGHIVNHIDPLLGGIPVARLRHRDVERLVAELVGKGLSPATVQLVIRTLSAALTPLAERAAIAHNPTRGVALPRVDREPVRALTHADADAIVAAVTDTWLERPVRVWLGSGLRRGEVLGLDQGDVGDGFVRVRVSKTLVRAVPVTEDAMDALRSAIAAAPRRGAREPVFFSPRTGDRMQGGSVSHALVRLAGLSPHALRHGAATLMLSGGAPMRVIAEQLGHRNPALTSRVYAHVIPEQQRDAVGYLERRRS